MSNRPAGKLPKGKNGGTQGAGGGGWQKRGMETKRKQLGTKNKEFYQNWLKRKIRNTYRRFKERPAKG